MGVALTSVLTFAALACFALAMAKHHRQAFGSAPSPRMAAVFRLLGAALTVAAPVPWMMQQGPTMALVTWLFCGTPLVGLAVVGLFTWLDGRTAR